jgi:hypothetical protein
LRCPLAHYCFAVDNPAPSGCYVQLEHIISRGAVKYSVLILLTLKKI